ncbi:MarC family protein [Glycocaulis sp.]|uniref:MarC family protein n=1 Tax=Glycocaulis sp. TaxID=1969725 RepID=UPI003D23553C
MPAFDLALLSAAFVTFFVVIDPIGVMPIFAGLTQGTSAAHRRNMAIKSVLVATIVLLGFAYGGEWLLSALGVSLDAFRAAGGVLLFLVALDMIFEKRTERREDRAGKLHGEGESAPEDISVFPMAIPMLAGPGAIASIMLYMSGSGGDLATQGVVLAAMAANLIVCLVLFLAAGPLMRVMGDTVAAMITRILGVILAALAAQFIFDGIAGALLG